MKVETFSGVVLCTLADGSTDKDIIFGVPESYLDGKHRDFVFVVRSDDPSVVQVGLYGSFLKLLSTKPSFLFGCNMSYMQQNVTQGVIVDIPARPSQLDELMELMNENGYTMMNIRPDRKLFVTTSLGVNR